MKSRMLIPIIFGSLLILVFFGKFLPGCVSGCKAKINNEDRTEHADENGNPTKRPGKAKAAPIPEATFQIVTTDKDGNVLSTSIGATNQGRWVGSVPDHGYIMPDSGVIIQVRLPGFYEKNRIWHDVKWVTMNGNDKSQPELSPRGDGDLTIIRAAQ